VNLRVRQAHADWNAARERIAVGEAAVAEAEESYRIQRNRYENGLVNVTELIRGQTAVLATQFRRLAALYDLRVARAALDEAAGILTADSEALL
jgi:outer membrane protein TolC